MLRKILTLILITTTFTVLGFGCKGLSKEEQASVKPITLNYWTVFNDVDQLEEFAAEYKKVRSYVNIKIRKVRQEQFEDLFVNALADDVGPDIVSIHTRDLHKYQNRLAAMPASVDLSKVYVQGKYFKETVIVDEKQIMPTTKGIKNNFVSAVYTDAVINEKIYGLPLAIDTLALYYNKDLLDQAGVPEPPTTWNEFMAAVKNTARFDKQGDILQAGAALGTGNNIDRSFDILSLLMMQSGLTMAKGAYVNFANGLEKPDSGHPALTALRFYTDFAQPTKEVYTWNEKMEDSLKEFTRGTTVFYFGFAYDYPRIKSLAPQLNLEIISIPQLNEEKPVNVANYWLESVVKKSRHQNEAWDFVRFITTSDNIKKYTAATRRPTPLRSQINEQKEDVVLAPFVSTVLQAENWYKGKNIEQAEKVFSDLIHNYLQPFSGSNREKLKRQADMIIQAAQRIRQTM